MDVDELGAGVLCGKDEVETSRQVEGENGRFGDRGCNPAVPWTCRAFSWTRLTFVGLQPLWSILPPSWGWDCEHSHLGICGSTPVHLLYLTLNTWSIVTVSVLSSAPGVPLHMCMPGIHSRDSHSGSGRMELRLQTVDEAVAAPAFGLPQHAWLCRVSV